MSDQRETHKVLDLALRIGEILLSSGAGAADVTATMLAITSHLGLRAADIDVTFTLLRMSYQEDPDEMPVLVSRSIHQRDIDYEDLTSTHHLVRDILGDHIDLTEARARVARINARGHRLPRWAKVLGSGAVGGGIALILGGGVVLTPTAVVAGMGVDLLTDWLNRQEWPMFYRQIAGGAFATVLALLVAVVHKGSDISLVITASIVLLLSGIGFMGAIQDALSGFYLTAGARIIEALLATAGLIAGVSAGLALAGPLGIELSVVQPGESSYAAPPFVLIGAVIAATAFAFTCYAPGRSLIAVAVATMLGQLVYLLLLDPGHSSPWAAGSAAVVIGLVSYTIAGRFGVPPFVVVVPAVVPMLPGLEIYRGLTYLQQGSSLGVVQLTAAAATTIALAAGVILGEYIAQPVKRNARRLERRLSGPRMVGVMHSRLGLARRDDR